MAGFAELDGGFGAASSGICEGHGVVPVGEGIASDLDYARKPREPRQIDPRFAVLRREAADAAAGGEQELVDCCRSTREHAPLVGNAVTRYERSGAPFARAGIDVTALDLRGHGGSGGP